MKKSAVTQELTNIYPPWARIRKDDQSVGYQLLNAVAQPMEHMEKQLIKGRSNAFLATANLDEIDLTHRVLLPETFSFDEDTSDPAGPVPVVPTVSGFLNSQWYDIVIAPQNDIESFWYDSIPNRASLTDTVSGVDHELLSFVNDGFIVSGLWEHHLDTGFLYVEASGPGTYLEKVGEELRRARVTLYGTNRQGQEDSETIIFPWPMYQRTLKEWNSITSIETRDMDEGIEVRLFSGAFKEEDYLDFWNLRYSENRRKVDDFWALGSIGQGSTLERAQYVTDEWEQLVLGFTDKEAKEAWELLDEYSLPVSGVDLTVQPFSDNVWVTTTSGLIHCYGTDSQMFENLDLVKDRTPGSHVQIDIEPRWLLLGEDIDFIPWHARPLEEIVRYRIWYQTPSGTRWGLLNGTQVPFSSDFWVVGRQLKRTIADLVTITATERGEYLLVLETIFDSDVTHTEKILVSVNYKLPKATIDISSLVTDSILGIDFDSDQSLWVRTSDKYYKIALHTDIMLIAYTNKVMYFKEPYEEVAVETNG
jgi:hypothetical protein